MQPATSMPCAARVATALSRACTARRDFIRASMEYPTMRPDQTSLTAHM